MEVSKRQSLRLRAGSASFIPGWTDFQSLGLKLSEATLALVLDDGQAFRWHALENGSWVGFFGSQCILLCNTQEEGVLWSAPRANPAADHAALSKEEALRRYFALDLDYSALADALPWRSDAHLQASMQAAPGLRLLRQPFWETLLCFLCSATKQIPQIKQMTEALAAKLGAPIIEQPKHSSLSGLPPLSFHRLPTPQEVAKADDATLKACALGFRAGNIRKTAAFIVEHPGWLEETASLPYHEAHARLCELPGVGAKIADCVLLYSGTQLCAFPVDTWIIKIMSRHYALGDWSPEQIAHFGRMHFGPSAGLAQQYLFNYERSLELR